MPKILDQFGQLKIASGTVSLSSGGAMSGSFGNNAVNGVSTAAIHRFTLASGAIGSGYVEVDQQGVGPILGQKELGAFVIASGTIGSNDIGSGAIVSGRIASGQIDTFKFASGAAAAITRYVVPLSSGMTWTLITEEIISGGRAVCISKSGRLRIAMAGTDPTNANTSGRMPAVGIVMDNVLSGRPANVYVHGPFQFSSGMADYSGWIGRTVMVGLSGEIVTRSGSWNSGGFPSNKSALWQRLGVAVNSGGFMANVDAICWSGSNGNVFVNAII